MFTSTRFSKVKVDFDCAILTIKISGTIKFDVLNMVLKELQKLSYKYIEVEELILDLSALNKITSAATAVLVCLFSALADNKMREIKINSGLSIERPPDRVLSYLTTLGFFTQMKKKANLLECENMVKWEEQKKKRRKMRKRATIANKDPNIEVKPIVFPISIIPKIDSSSIAGANFQASSHNYINGIIDTYSSLFYSDHYNFSEEEFSVFCAANGELFENIFEHSLSWGIGVIHANPREGTTVSYYDIGIGFKENLNSSPKAGKEYNTFSTDCEAINWACKEKNSSKINGNGRGLTIVQEFIEKSKGSIAIRSGKCMLYKKPEDFKWRKMKNIQWFPGTQINFFVPCIGSFWQTEDIL